jgi:hypothetical protein
MRVSAFAFLPALGLLAGTAPAEEVKSGIEAGKKGISAFNIKAYTGPGAGQTYCQV